MLNTDSSDVGTLERRFRARDHCFRGDIALKLGDRQGALAEHRRAVALDPGGRVARGLVRMQESERTGAR